MEKSHLLRTLLMMEEPRMAEAFHLLVEVVDLLLMVVADFHLVAVAALLLLVAEVAAVRLIVSVLPPLLRWSLDVIGENNLSIPIDKPIS